MTTPDDATILENTRRWIEKAVIGLNLCPFARAVYVKNQVRIVVSHARHLDAFLDELDAELTLLKETPADQIDTTLLVHPSLFPDFFVFNDFLNVVDDVVAEHELEGGSRSRSFIRCSSLRRWSWTTSPTPPTVRLTPLCICCVKTALRRRSPAMQVTLKKSWSAISPH